MANICTGYCHLINTVTNTYTASANEFDTIAGGFGGFLEKNIEKLIKNHDRRAGTFKDNSVVGDCVAGFSKNECDLYELSNVIARRVLNKKIDMEIYEETMLFIMDVGMNGPYIVGMELKRASKYYVNPIDNCNEIRHNTMIVPNATPKRATLFTISLSDLSVTVLETPDDSGNYFYSDNILQADMHHSINQAANIARKAMYNTIVKVEGRESYKYDVKSDEKIDIINNFEATMSSHVFRNRKIDFEEIADELLAETKMLCREFKRRLKNHNVPLQVRALSDAKFIMSQITNVSQAQRIRLESGIEIIVPGDITEVDLKLQNIDGELVEVKENIDE